MKISIIIVEYHSISEIEKYLSRFSVFTDLEIIVSSNSMYSPNRISEIRDMFPNCKWLFNSKNGGFAYAMNNGLAVATGDILVISNPDCSIMSGLYEMAEFLLNNPQLGAIAPKIVDAENNIQDSCRKYVTFPRYVFRQMERILCRKECLLDRRFNYDEIQTVDWVIGAFIMVTRDAYIKTNGLCEDYFMYAEDLDWCTRIRQSGYEIAYYPKALVEYKGTRSARSSWKYMRIFIKSMFLFWKKHGFFTIKPQRTHIVF